MTADQEKQIRRLLEEDHSLSSGLGLVLLREVVELRDMLASCRKERAELQQKVWGRK